MQGIDFEFRTTRIYWYFTCRAPVYRAILLKINRCILGDLARCLKIPWERGLPARTVTSKILGDR
jgi:hypothetical protein